MSETSQSGLNINPRNVVEAKVAARLSQIWDQESKCWTAETKQNFVEVASLARLSYGTCTPSSHKIHRRLNGRAVTVSDYTVLAAMFGTNSLGRLNWWKDFQRSNPRYKHYEGVVKPEDRDFLLASKRPYKAAEPKGPERECKKEATSTEDPKGAESTASESAMSDTQHEADTISTAKVSADDVSGNLVDNCSRQGTRTAQPVDSNLDWKRACPIVPTEESSDTHSTFTGEPTAAHVGASEAVKLEPCAKTPEANPPKEDLADSEPLSPRIKRFRESVEISEDDVWQKLTKTLRAPNTLQARIEAIEVRIKAQEEEIDVLKATLSRTSQKLAQQSTMIEAVAKYLAGSS
ncbi:uncharacterized protein UV8b_06773 [Ustilaginoidea virens]|uniref:Uncharacterized protein n=1 Tax=Ustilaginoidea virens TaxID=1159556 RepID=A0A063CBW6_USTVR|nr:uncharacterized protein UV8b_06773 [Ustilaginoidea virens]QUC22532.1 hypothetical protein UV8b_06773 [Ustilaginoidea virens]GAO16793.1 hypothetical protein UVI_02057620 [Ustilaginoidea virens]